MPWSDRQHRLFEFVAHNPRAAHREGLGISQSDAQRMAGEGIKRAGGGVIRSSASEAIDYLRRNSSPARRLRIEHAADIIPGLDKMFSKDALVSGSADPMAAYDPSKFEKLALPLYPYARDQYPEYAQNIRYLRGLLKKGQPFDQVPFLRLDNKVPVDDQQWLFGPWNVTAHEGRHRSRAMAQEGIESSLLRLPQPGVDPEQRLSTRNELVYPQFDFDRENQKGGMYMGDFLKSDPFRRGGIVRMADGGAPPINMTPMYQVQANSMPAAPQMSLEQIEASGGINPYGSLVNSSGATAYLRGGRVRRFAGGGGMPQVTRTGGPQFGGIGGTDSFSNNPLEKANSPGNEGDVRTRLVDTINRRHQQESTRLDADQATMTLMRNSSTPGLGAQPYLRRYAPPGMTSAMNDLFPSASTAFGQAQESWKRQLGQYVPNPMPYADGGAVQYDPRTYSPPRYDSGHDLSDETLDFIRAHAPSLLAGVGATAAPFMLPRPVNALARPIMRRMAKPVLGIEAASSKPLSEAQSLARYNLARQGTPHPYRDLPMETGQGAWSPGEGEPMQFNPLHMQELPRVSGPLKDNWMGLDYAAQMGENLEQAATPVSRFVPNLINTPKGANAFELSGVDREGLKQIAEMGGQNWVTAHRPGNRAMVFPLGDESVESMAKRMAGTLGTRARYGRSDPGVDRMLLSREPLGYEDALYRDFKISPRPKGFREYEDSVLNSLPLGAR